MSVIKLKYQTKKLLQLFSRYEVPVVYVEDIADFLGCSRDAVENELGLLCEDGFLIPVFNAHCGMCGNITGTYGSLRDLEAGAGIAECPHCLSQEKVLVNNLVSAWAVCKESEDGDEYRFDDPNLTVIGSRNHMIMAEKDDFIDEAGLAANSPGSDYF